MARIIIVILFFILLFSLLAYGSGHRENVRITSLEGQKIHDYQVAPRFSTAELCTVRHDDGAYWAITNWLIGDELYKSYQNPSLSCDLPYPFSVEDVYMVLACSLACTLYVSTDVESADFTDPDCPIPGNLLSISQMYEVNLPQGGLYQIAIPLDSPAVVEEPYFAGFYYSGLVDTLARVSLVTDNIPVPCVAYNIWDTTIGWVDLDSTGYPGFPQFPGRLLLFSSGTTGGSSGEEPVPSVSILKPADGEAITGEAIIWAAETAGSHIVDYARFDYRDGVDWFEIGRDYDGSRALRNGVDTSGSGEGYTIPWDYSGLTEGTYWLKVTIYDTLGRFDVDSIPVEIDPTPPNPVFTIPESMDTICLPINLTVTSDDENISSVIFEKKNASMDHQVVVLPIDQSPHGNTYCGPIAGAIAVKYWFDEGYIYGMREGNQYLPLDTVVERMADLMRTGRNNGTYDDLFYFGLRQYILTHGNELLLNACWNPDYADFRILFEERELLVILGLAGSPGLYLVTGGVDGLEDQQGRYAFKAADPITASIIDTYMRNNGGGAEVYYDGSWHALDVIITVMGNALTINRDYVGSGSAAGNQWSYTWSSSDMIEDSAYFVSATAIDATGREELATSFVLNKCELYMKGDYDANDVVNAGDALYLENYIYKNGPAPVGGAGRGDANCDGNIDIGDIAAIILYIYGVGLEPCY